MPQLELVWSLWRVRVLGQGGVTSEQLIPGVVVLDLESGRVLRVSVGSSEEVAFNAVYGYDQTRSCWGVVYMLLHLWPGMPVSSVVVGGSSNTYNHSCPES